MGEHIAKPKPKPKKVHPVADGNIKSVRPPPHDVRHQPSPPQTATPTPYSSSTSLRHHLSPPQTETKRAGFSCCKCICWSISIMITLIIIIGATIGILYLAFKPKLPHYSVDRLTISQLTLNLDLSLYASFNVQITAINPNKKIGIFYQKGSHLSVWYKNTNLCHGSIPVFYQGHLNKTVLNVALAGQNQYGRTLLAALQEQQQTGRIPLDLKVDVPVRIQLERLKLSKVRIVGKCMLIVDRLSTNNKISIKATSCKFRLKL